MAPRLGGLGSTLIFPMAFVAAEFLRSRFSPAATWGSIAYTQYGYLPLMQVAAFVGIWGITFLMAWFASTFDWAWSRGFEWSVVRTPVLTYAAVLGAIVLGGSVRLALAPTDRPSLRTATLNRPVDLFVPGEMTRIAEGRVSPDERKRLADKLTRLHDWFLEGSRREARAGARLIVWPEQNLLIFKEDEPAFLERAQRLAADERVYLAMGMGTVHLGEALPFENKLVLIDPSGRIMVSYLKSHAVAGWEAGIMKVGDGRVPVIATQRRADGDGDLLRRGLPGVHSPGRAGLRGSPDRAGQRMEGDQGHSLPDGGVPGHRERRAARSAAASGLSSAFDPWGRVLGVADYLCRRRSNDDRPGADGPRPDALRAEPAICLRGSASPVC